MFLYGPPGTGKTSVAERLIRTHTDPVFVPRARRGRQPDHQRLRSRGPRAARDAAPRPRPPLGALPPPEHRRRRRAHPEHDGPHLRAPATASTWRPSRCRPTTACSSSTTSAGRRSRPEALLNRWIVPLDRRLDYLSLSYGVRFDIPFDVKVVFSTNLDPATLGDEAFYRRIQNKILVSSISDAEFDEVLHRCGRRRRHHHRARRQRAPPSGEPRPRRRRPAPVPAQGGLQDPPGRVHVQPARRWCSTTLRVDRVASIYFTRAGEIRATMAEATLAEPPSSLFATPKAQAPSAPMAAPPMVEPPLPTRVAAARTQLSARRFAPPRVGSTSRRARGGSDDRHLDPSGSRRAVGVPGRHQKRALRAGPGPARDRLSDEPRRLDPAA